MYSRPLPKPSLFRAAPMAQFLRKKLSSPFLNSIPDTNALNLLLLRCLSSSSPPIQNPPPKPTFMAEYLVQSCGFSPEKAAVVSKHVSRITSPAKPDRVRHFLKHHSFTDPQIRTLIINYPQILYADVNSMEHNLSALRSLGFDDADLRKLVSLNPQSLQLRSAISRLEYWKTFLGGDMKRLLMTFLRNRCLVNLDIDKGLVPKIAFLEQYGISRTGILKLVVRGNCFIKQNEAMMESVLNRAEELGFIPGSAGYFYGITSFSGISDNLLKAKMEIYKSFGWSEEELRSAIRKFPIIVRLSEENIRTKMAFFVGRAGCTQSYIALHPHMLGYSLDRRLIPRHYVLNISNKLTGNDWEICAIMSLTEEKFLEKIVLPCNDKLPTLLELYTEARAGNFLV